MSPELVAALERVKDYVMSPAEVFEQRVSFCYAQQDWSAGTIRSKDVIRQQLIAIYGQPEAQAMTNQPSAETVALATAFLPRALTAAEVLFSTELLQAFVRAPDPRTAALVAALEGVVHFGDAVAYRSDPLSVALRQWIAAGSEALATFHASNPASAQVAGEGV